MKGHHELSLMDTCIYMWIRGFGFKSDLWLYYNTFPKKLINEKKEVREI